MPNRPRLPRAHRVLRRFQASKHPANRHFSPWLTASPHLLVCGVLLPALKTQAQAPLRSLDQRMEALKRANDIRVRRAQLKKDLKTGSANIDDVLRNPPDYVSTAKVFDILMAVPKFGRVQDARFLNQCRI